MRTLQLLVGAVLILLLAAIAYDLHRVANAVGPRGNIEAAMMVPYARVPETHEQHDARLKRERDEGQHDLNVIFDRGDLDPAKAAKVPRKSSRP